MDDQEAFAALGVSLGAPPDVVRRAFRARIRAVHSDVVASDDSDTRRLIDAYTVARAYLVADGVVAGRTEPVPGADRRPMKTVDSSVPAPADDAPPDDALEALVGDELTAVLISDDTIAVDLPGDETYRELVAVGNQIGDVTYLDRDDSSILELLVRTTNGDVLSVVMTLQGRSNETTEVFVTMEPLDVKVRNLPSVGAVATLVASHLNERAACSDR